MSKLGAERLNQISSTQLLVEIEEDSCVEAVRHPQQDQIVLGRAGDQRTCQEV